MDTEEVGGGGGAGTYGCSKVKSIARDIVGEPGLVMLGYRKGYI
jgi:hypothetical protein